MARGAPRRHGELMKSLKAWCAASAVLLAACCTVPAPDGEAVECDACETLWIHMFPPVEPPGLYRLNHAKQWRACSACEGYAERYFRSGKIPAFCPRCRGRLAVRPVTFEP